jgi:16S rRNA (cytosine1402-N4)-methyltransferase
MRNSRLWPRRYWDNKFRQTTMNNAYHIPVMLRESVDILEVTPSGVYIDATLGGGGHSRAILSKLGPEGRLICLDMDPDAIANAPQDSRVTAVRSNFRFIHNHVRNLGCDRAVDGILADLGVSSHQFDTPERGFSFRFDAPLDMRMNTSAGESAADLLNTCTQERLADILHIYGEVDGSRKIASLICTAREKSPIRTTADLNAAIESILPPVAPHKTLARIYQALRIEINGEMRSLEHLLRGIAKSLRPGGIAAIITYHSLEDRMVKNFFRCGNPSGRQSSDIYGRTPSPFSVITRKPVLPSDAEVAQNTRARSAKLRAARRAES